MTIGEAITKLRQEEGLNKVGFAAMICSSKATITYWEAGTTIPQMKRIVNICNVFKRNMLIEIIGGNIHAQFMLKTMSREMDFDKKILACEKGLRYYCTRFRKNVEINDLVQDTLYTALRRHYTYDCHVGMMTWLIGIAKNIARKKQSRLMYIEHYIENDIITDESEEYFRQHKNVFEHIEKLSLTRKKMYELSLIGMQYKEIAEKFGMVEGTIKNYMRSTKLELREMIEKDTLCNSQ